MSKQILFDLEAQVKMRSGLEKLSRSVQATMGPKGRLVVLTSDAGKTYITKDGVTVAKAIELPDPAENAGAQFVKKTALKMAHAAGDGTTTATVLAHALFSHSLKYITAGANPQELIKGIQLGAKAVTKQLQSQAQQIKDPQQLRKIASIAANGDREIGDLVAEALEKAGRGGLVTLAEAAGTQSEVSVTSGTQIHRGYLSPHFITNPEKQTAELETPLLLITDQKVTVLAEILPLLEQVAETRRPLLIIAEDIETAALSALVLNHAKGVLKIMVVKAPGVGEEKREILEDLAMLSGGTFISAAAGHRLNKVKIEHLGTFSKALVDQHQTTLIEGGGDKPGIEKLLNTLQQALREANGSEKERLQKRLGRLGGGVAQLNLAAQTEFEMREKQDRAHDALGAAQAALEEGFVAGGGVALLQATAALAGVTSDNHDQLLGLRILRQALSQPAAVIAQNAGAEANVVVETIQSGPNGRGYNAATNVFEDMVAAGIIDPLKVTRLSLESAVSVAALMLNTYCLIIENIEKAEQI